jgi:hypothetical protein
MTNLPTIMRAVKAWQYMVLLAVAVWLLPACTQERQPCLTPKTASLNLHFVHFPVDTAINNNSTQDTALPSAIFGAITGGTVQEFIYRAPSAYFTISLSSTADSCSWIFKADSALATYDTLNFYYRRQLKFLSNACGYTNFYTIDSVHTTKSTGIDSVIITNPSVTNDVNTRQLKIYMHPDF